MARKEEEEVRIAFVHLETRSRFEIGIIASHPRFALIFNCDIRFRGRERKEGIIFQSWKKKTMARGEKSISRITIKNRIL